MHSYRKLKYAGKPWIRQSFFANVSKALFRQTFLLPKYFTIRYIHILLIHIVLVTNVSMLARENTYAGNAVFNLLIFSFLPQIGPYNYIQLHLHTHFDKIITYQ